MKTRKDQNIFRINVFLPWIFFLSYKIKWILHIKLCSLLKIYKIMHKEIKGEKHSIVDFP